MRRRGGQRLWAIGAAAAALLTGAPGALSAATLDALRARGTLRWGADEQGGEPYAYEDRAQGGALVGFEVDLAAALARALGVRAGVRPERLVDADPVAGAGNLRRGAERHRGHAGAGRRASPSRAPTTSSPSGWSRAGATAASAIWRRCAGVRVGTLANTQAWDLLRDAGAARRPLRRRRRTVRRSRASPHRRGAAGRHHRRPLCGPPPVAGAWWATSPRGATRSRVRPADQELRAALDRALGELIASGGWRQILARWGLDNPRQARLSPRAEAPRCAAGRPHRQRPPARLAR